MLLYCFKRTGKTDNVLLLLLPVLCSRRVRATGSACWSLQGIGYETELRYVLRFKEEFISCVCPEHNDHISVLMSAYRPYNLPLFFSFFRVGVLSKATAIQATNPNCYCNFLVGSLYGLVI
jgi:hypothetical protein